VTASAVVLHQFPYSHYNEKARWALDWKGIAHTRVDYLPGPHAPQIQWLSGQAQVPVLQIGARKIAGSAAIIDALESLHPERPLLPTDPAQRADALALQRHFDDEVGVRIRQALFSVLIHEPDCLCRIFAGKRSAPVRALYRGVFPVTRLVMGRSMTLFDARAIDEAFASTQKALDGVASRIGPSGQLVGDRFSVADLTAAANLALLAHPGHPDMRRPEPMPDTVRELLSSYESHPAMRWTLEQYRLHRPLRT
jgi:glutathione S-transferase